MTTQERNGEVELMDKLTLLPKENRDGDMEIKMLMLDG
jgi:hypothetical protein